MAEEDAPENAEDASNESQGLGKKKLIVLAILALVIVGASVGGTLTVLKLTGGSDMPEEEQVETPAEEVEVVKKAIYYPLKPPILVTFDAKGRQRYLQAEITLLTRDNDVIAAIELHMPMIRNALVLLIGSQLFEEIQTAEGKELLRVQCLQEIQRLLEKEIGKPGVEQVLFENLVMQ
ncbi:hypothetical protein TDB9533_02055 [Thalassocella blandensis]|nr:hypothetical protein TDB9533_02055 [Thalassocella blandensis]